MKKITILLIIALLGILMSSIGYGAVGVGISPSKMVYQIESDTTQEMTLLVYNTGDYPMTLRIGVEGNVAEITEISPSSVEINPEPKPHAMPIKNGKKIKVTFTPPAKSKERIYTGKITASGGPTGGQLGGSVGVATLVEIRVPPPESILALITTTHIMIACIILALIIILLLLRKAGLRIGFKK